MVAGGEKRRQDVLRNRSGQDGATERADRSCGPGAQPCCARIEAPLGRTDLANSSTAKCGWGDTSRPVDGHAVLKGLGLAVGWGLQKWISEEDRLLAGCC